MDWNKVSGSWHAYSGAAKAYWGELTDDDLKVIGGKRSQLVGKLQTRYGLTADQAEREIENWLVRTVAYASPKVGKAVSLASAPAHRVVNLLGDGLGNTVRRNAVACLLTTAAAGFVLGTLWHRISKDI